MAFLFLDTETNGLPIFPRAPQWFLPNWPRLIQLGWVVTDNQGQEVKSACHVIRPVGFKISPQAISIHGITQEIAERDGEPIKQVLKAFRSDLQEVDTCAAHNISFDVRVLRAEFLRQFIGNPFKGKNLRCTMRESTEFCRLPRADGFKWPSLNELYRILFNEDLKIHHHALADARTSCKCFWELHRRNVM
ncbi:MAG TPA: 3'-5' exonuclease [Pirellulaceae bacterium]|nr:3'-5' exonuclease [Pirellulaceae bacterium]HMO91945.1 3'-5' exonuclease [Pirellulaceae bacterium]HMP68744.1 3'-5' exonuclease [Pirellulaceae bacterium]